MTVAELIEQLQQQPQGAEVMLEGEDGVLVAASALELLPEDDTTMLLLLRSHPNNRR